MTSFTGNSSPSLTNQNAAQLRLLQERERERVGETERWVARRFISRSPTLLSHTPSAFPWRPHWCANLEITLKCSLQWVWVWLWFNLSFRTCAKRLWLPWSGRRSGYSPLTALPGTRKGLYCRAYVMAYVCAFNCALIWSLASFSSGALSCPSSCHSSGLLPSPSSVPPSVPSSCYPAQLAGSILWSSLMDPSS